MKKRDTKHSKNSKRPDWEDHEWKPRKVVSPAQRKLIQKKLLLDRYDAMPKPNLMKLARELLAERGVVRSQERYPRMLGNEERRIGRYLKERKERKKRKA
jgi:hypothetical protein